MRGELRRIADRPIPRVKQALGEFSEDTQLSRFKSKKLLLLFDT